MAERLQGLTLGFLDLDNEERFVKTGDYTHALNIRRFASSGGVAAPIKNVVGTLAIGNTLPAGQNLCIGQTALEEVNTIYFFIYNSLGNHSIYQYNTITDNITLIAQDSFLKFSPNNYITGANAINSLGGDGVLLYWTDNLNPPRKINVKKAILHRQGDYTNGYAIDFSTGSASQKQKYYDAIKHPPLTAPTFEFQSDSNLSTNNIYGRTFQFRYRYIYDDGERSAYSPWSKIAISESLKNNGSTPGNFYDTQFNRIAVSFNPATSNNVEKVELTVREGNGGDEKLWKRVDNLGGSTPALFYNNEVQTVVGAEDAQKLYDAVPLLAKAQEIYGDLLFYANTVDGYDQTEILGGATPIYKRGFDNNDKAVIPVSAGSAGPIIDFSGISVSEGKIFVLSISGEVKVSDPFAATFTIPITVFETYTALAGDDLDDVIQALANKVSSLVRGPIITGFNASVDLANDKIFVSFPTAPKFTVQGGTFSVFSNNSFAVDGAEAKKTHKGGSFHPYGVVYSDHAGRLSTVNKLASPYVKFYSERDGEAKEFLGAADMRLSIRNTPPAWATRFHIVYAGNRSVDEYLQYTCAGVFRGPNQTSPNDYDRIYVSLRNFQGEAISWKESSGALPSYSFVEGDRVRVWSYYNNTSSAREGVSETLDFKVLGYELLPNSDENPLFVSGDSDATKRRKSGYFLIVENPNVKGWSVSEIASALGNNTNNWYNGAAEEGAYFEIYRPKSQAENLPYFEIGETYEIGDAGLASRYHKGSVRNQNETSISYSVDDESVANDYFDLSVSSVKITAGDTIQSYDSGNNLLGTHKVTEIGFWGAGLVRVFVDANVVNNTDEIRLVTPGEAVIVIEGGDSWYKPRIFFSGDSIASFRADVVGVEDYYCNDFISSGNSWDRGRVNAFSEEQRQLRRPATVWVSEPFSPDTNFNGFSSFNLANTPYRDYPQRWGGIQVMRQNNTGIILWQEDKTSQILVNRNILESSEGQQTITVSNDTLGQIRTYQGDYGISQQPESLCANNGRYYWKDLKRGCALRLSLDGITEISGYEARTYFYRESREYLSEFSQVRIVGGFDDANDEAVWTWPQITRTSIESSGDDLSTSLSNATIDSAELVIPVVVQQGVPAQLTFGSDPRNWEDRVENFGDRVGPLYSTNEIAEVGYVELPQETIATDTALNVFVTLNFENSNQLSRGNLNVASGEITLPANDADYPILSGNTEIVKSGFTIAFYEPANRWSGFYSFAPEFYGGLNGNFYAWKAGAMYKMGGGVLYNNFFGTQYTSQVTPVLNASPFEVKTYRAMWIDGNSPWGAEIDTNLNGTEISSSDFIEKEGRYYAQLPFTNSGTTDSNLIGIGTIDSISSNKISVNGFFAAGSGIFVGDAVYSGSSLIGTIADIDSANDITLSSVAGISPGDYVYVERNGLIDGDTVRGYYAKVAMTNDESDNEVELYSVDLLSAKSFR